MTVLPNAKSPTSRVMRLAIPLMASNLSQTLLSLTDTMMVGRLDGGDGDGPLAAMGAAGILFLVLFLFLTATFMGVQILTARRFGEGRLEECGRVLNCALAINILVGLTAGALGLLYARDITGWIFSEASIADLSASYLHFRWGGIVTLCVLWSFKGFYYGIGFTKVDMFLTLAMNVVNVGLNLLFIYGNFGAPEMGMPGAGLSSVMATGMACLVYLGLSLRPAFRKRYSLFRLSHLNWNVVGRILRLSGPRALQCIAFSGSIVFFKLIENACGQTALATSTVVWKSFGIPVLLAIGLGATASTLVGQFLGAGKPEEAEVHAYAAVKIGIVISLALASLVWVFPDLILRVFTDKPEVIEAGRGPMRIMATFQMLDTVGIILSRALSGAGCTLYVMLSEVLIQILVVVPAALLLTTFFPHSLSIVWLAWALYMTAWFLTMFLKFRTGTWKTVEV